MEAPSRRGSAAVSSNAAAVWAKILICYSHEDADSVRVIAEIREFLEGPPGRNSCCQSKTRTSGLTPTEGARKTTGVGRKTDLSSGPPGRAPLRRPLAPPGELRRRLGPWRGFTQRATPRRPVAWPTTDQRPNPARSLHADRFRDRSRASLSSFFMLAQQVLHRQFRIADYRLARSLEQLDVPASCPRDGCFHCLPAGLWNAGQQNLSEAVQERE